MWRSIIILTFYVICANALNMGPIDKVIAKNMEKLPVVLDVPDVPDIMKNDS